MSCICILTIRITADQLDTAAVFAAVSVVLGALAHIRGFGGTCFTTCFASFGAAIAIIAFAFDLGLFIVAKKRIESSDVGGKADLGNALWMTLAAAILLLTSGCFFGFGRCVIRDREKGKAELEKMRPLPDVEYGQQFRQAAFVDDDRKDNYVTLNGNTATSGLPAFPDRNGESVPLTAGHNEDDWDEPHRYAANGSHARSDQASHISGVGEGYGRRYDGPAPSSPAAYAGAAALGVAGAAGAGAAGIASRSQQRQTSSSTVEPFTAMYGAGTGDMGVQRTTSPGPISPTHSGQYQYPPYGAFPAGAAPYAASQPSQSVAMPMPSHPAPASQVTGATQGYYTHNDAAPMTSGSPPPALPPHPLYVQNPSPPPSEAYGPAPSYTTHQPMYDGGRYDQDASYGQPRYDSPASYNHGPAPQASSYSYPHHTQGSYQHW